MFLMVRAQRKTVYGPVSDKIRGKKNDWIGWNRHYRYILGIRLGLQWKLTTLDKPIGFLVLKPSGVRFAEVSFLKYLVNWRHMAGIGIGIIFI